MDFQFASLLHQKAQDSWKNRLSEYFRVKLLNPNIHIADINYEVLRSSDPELTPAKYLLLINRLQEAISRLGNDAIYALDNMIFSKKNNDSTVYTGQTILIRNDPKFGNLIISPSYATLQSTISPVFTQFANEFEDASTLLGTDEDGKIIVNVGHIYNSSTTATRTPLSSRINYMIKLLPAALKPTLTAHLDTLQNLHARVSTNYIFNRQDISQTAKNQLLARGAILVTLQSKYINQDILAKEEKKIADDIEKMLKSPEYLQMMVNAPGSKSIKDEIGWAIAETIRTGKVPSSSHTTKKQTAASDIALRINVKATAVKIGLPKRIRSSQKSLTSLQNLINMALHEQIKRNMGTGEARNVLNYRTGRFAHSAEVQRLTISKEGMISAFYDYMKYPYQTFQPGFKQGNPISRDPKLLIGKSIREIAAKAVNNRMRAVLV